MKPESERRNRARVLLRCPLRLYRRGSTQPLQAETENLSSAGFYCLVHEAFLPGDCLDCILTLPAQSPDTSAGDVNLYCEVEVMRVDSFSSGFGVACRIDHYSLILRPEIAG